MIQQEFNGLYRYDDRGERFYARVANGKVIWYPSVTRIIKATSPTPHGLLAWYAKHGIEDAAKLRDEAAERGTQMHTLIEEYLQTGVVILDGLPEFHQKALCSFVRFCQDHDVRPIHTERVIYSDEYVYAGACDLICTMQWKGAVIKALIDYKSGTNIYDDYAVQLGMYWKAAEEQGYGIDRVFNWSPKDFRKEVPTYTLTDQTEKAARSRYEGELEHRCRLFHATNDPTPRSRMVITGMLPNDVNIRTTDPNQVILDRHAAGSGEVTSDFVKAWAKQPIEPTPEFGDIQTPGLAGNYLIAKTPQGPRVFLHADAVANAKAHAATTPQPYESTQTSEAGPSSEPA